jgi:hypothetical protein
MYPALNGRQSDVVDWANQMVARVFVKPTKTAEFVELTFVLTATGADFREVY